MLTTLLVACVAPTDAPTSSSSVRFAPGDGPIAFGDVPFPSDLYRDDDGRIRIGDFPNPHSDEPLLTAVRALLAGRAGFCTTCNVTFRIDGDLDPASVPPSTATLGDPLVLVDVDPGSADFGEPVPLRVQWDPAAGVLNVRPARGITLHRGTRYAAAVTGGLLGDDGLPLSPSPGFDADPTVALLGALGVEGVVGVAAFTTDDPTTDLQGIRAAIRARPGPSASVDRVWTGPALDELLGVPSEDRPGIDIPPIGDGEASIPHATTLVVVAGTFPAPRFVSGSGSDIGEVLRDPAGAPSSSADEPVPYLLIVPRDADLQHLPVVVSHHGFNASRTTGFALADTAGRAGFAVLAIDAFQHGERAPSARDELHAMRGTDGPDGFAETTPLEVSGRLFGLIGAGPEMSVYPGYPLGGFEQFAADAMSAVHLVRDGDLQAIRAADPALAELSFDGDRIAFFGNSMGAVVGTLVVSGEPDVRAAVLNVLPGSIVDTLVESTEFRPLAEDLLLPALGVDAHYDEIDRSLAFDPLVDLVRWVMEPVDPQALAPFLRTERIAGDEAPELLIQLAGHDEVAAPAASESVVAAAGIGGQGEFAFAPVSEVDLPVSGAAAERFAGGMHGMFEVQAQLSSWEEPLVPPLVAREAPATLENPIVAVHAQIEAFLGSFREEGRATIVP